MCPADVTPAKCDNEFWTNRAKKTVAIVSSREMNILLQLDIHLK